MNNVRQIIWGKGLEDDHEIPKIIWLFWEGKSSEVVNRCIDKIHTTLIDFDIRILNFETLKQYLPHIIPINENLPIANYSDIIRLDLLRTYGGIWLDASILLTEDFKWLYFLKKKYKPELLGFYTDLFTRNLNQPIVETWFLATSKNSTFIKAWYEEFALCYTSENPHEYYKELKNNETLIQGLFKDPSADYLICYIAAIQVMLKNDNYRLLLFSANESAHLYKFKFKYTLNQFNDFFLKDKSNNQLELPSLIKFINSTRTHLDNQINIARYSKKSLLYVISPDSNYYKNKLIRYINYSRFIINNLYKKIV